MSNGVSVELEGNLTLSDRLKAFKSSQFNPDTYIISKCQTINEKAIRNLCSLLLDLKKASAEEMRRSVYANYSAFIRTSRELSNLEGQLLSLRNFLSTQSALVLSLSETARIKSLLADSDDSIDHSLAIYQDSSLSNTEDWLTDFLENLDVLLAEKRVELAIEALDRGEKSAIEAARKHTMSPSSLATLETCIKERRQKLAHQLAETTIQPSTRGQELLASVSALKRLGDGQRAHALLLHSHQKMLQSAMQNLRPASCSNKGAFTMSLSQLVFSTIAQAGNDSLTVLGEEPAYSSGFVTWSVKQVEAYAHLLKKHVLAFYAASGSLRVVAECVQIALGHCSLLEARGLTLSPALTGSFQIFIDQALHNNLRRIGLVSAALAASEDWVLTHSPIGGRPYSSTSSLNHSMSSQPKLSISANRFNTMVQGLFEDVFLLESIQLEAAALDGVFRLFNVYADLLIEALPGSADSEDNVECSSTKLVRMAETEPQQLAVVLNASLLADELLPRAAMKLLPNTMKSDEGSMTGKESERQCRLAEQREWKKKLHRCSDKVRDSFCRWHALDLIFSEERDILLSPFIYTSMNDLKEEPEWFPSPVFQQLFAKVTRIASLATDMFAGRERSATLLLMRLIDTVILWLSDEQNFWRAIEGPKPLGAFGLQQLYLDMEFVLLFSSQGRFLSRHLYQVIKDIIARAIEAVSSSGADPYSVLPEEDWFAEVAQISIKMLTGKANFDKPEEDDSIE